MRARLRDTPWAAALLLLALTARDADAAAGRYRLALPRHASGQMVLMVSVGVVPKGTEIDIYAPSGVLLGTVSPFAVHGKHKAGTYPIPVPGGTRAVDLKVRRFGTPPHPPSRREVTGVKLLGAS